MCWICPGSLLVISLTQAPARSRLPSGMSLADLQDIQLPSKARHPQQPPFFYYLWLLSLSLTTLIWDPTDRAASPLLPAWPLRSTASHLFCKGPGKAKEASRGFFCLPEEGPVSISLLLSHLPQLDGKRGRAPRLLLVFHPLHFSQGWKDEVPWAYFSFELSDTPEPPHFLFSSATTLSRSSTCSQCMQVSFPLSSST